MAYELFLKYAKCHVFSVKMTFIFEALEKSGKKMKLKKGLCPDIENVIKG